MKRRWVGSPATSNSQDKSDFLLKHLDIRILLVKLNMILNLKNIFKIRGDNETV